MCSPTQGPPRPPWTVRQVAELMKVSEDTVWRAIRRGEIEATKVGRSYRVPAHEADRLAGGREDQR